MFGFNKQAEKPKGQKTLREKAEKKLRDIALLFLVVEVLLVGVFAGLMRTGLIQVGQDGPLVIQNVQAKEIEAEVAPKVKDPSELISEAKNASLLKAVYQLESQSGKEDSCKKKGQFNGFGLGRNSAQKWCFDTFQDAVTNADGWFTDKLSSGMSENQALCYWNTGIVSRSCWYSDTIATLR